MISGVIYRSLALTMLSGELNHWKERLFWENLGSFTRILFYQLASDRDSWSGLKAEVESRGGECDKYDRA